MPSVVWVRMCRWIGELARLALLDRGDHLVLLGRDELGAVAFAAVMAMGGIRRLCGLGLGKSPCHRGGPGDCAGPTAATGKQRREPSGTHEHSP